MEPVLFSEARDLGPAARARGLAVVVSGPVRGDEPCSASLRVDELCSGPVREDNSCLEIGDPFTVEVGPSFEVLSEEAGPQPGSPMSRTRLMSGARLELSRNADGRDDCISSKPFKRYSRLGFVTGGSKIQANTPAP